MLSDQITLLNKTVLECLNERDEVKIVRSFTEVGKEVLGADFGFVWLNSFISEDLRLVYKSSNLPFKPKTPRKDGRNRKVLESSVSDYVSNVAKHADAKYLKQFIKSFVIISISYQKKVYGNIVLCFKKLESFPKEKKVLCAFIGNTVAQAITINRLVASEYQARKISERQGAYFRALFENSHEIITLISTNGTIMYVSPFITKIYGIAVKDVLGRNISDFIYNASSARISKYIEQIIKNPNTVVGRVFQAKDKKGNLLSLESVAFNMLTNPSVEGIVIHIRDITERKKSEILKETARLLEEERLKTEFIANATHEFRTPLAIIRGNTDLALRNEVKPGQPVVKTLRAINKEIEHLSNMLSDLVLLTSKNAQIRKDIFFQEINLPDIIREVIKRCLVITHKKDINIRIKKLPKKLLIMGDAMYLEKLVTNLIRNAVTYGKEGGYINIELIRRRTNIEIVVSDNGIGISKSDLPYVFDRFYRVDKSHHTDIKNTGLGLAISKWIASVHNGSISVKSEEHKGTTFVVSIPILKKR